MASVVISSRGGQSSGRGIGADQTYYCFDCDRRLTIVATSDTGIIVCPICGHLVLEEFETPSSPPPSPPPFPMPPPRSNASVDLESFFPTSSDIDSEVELFDPLPPPPPPLPFFFTTHTNTTFTGASTGGRVVDCLSQLHIYPPPPPPYSRNFGDFNCNFDSDVRHLRLPSSPPPPPPAPETDRRTPCPQFPDPSTPIPLPPSERELDELRLPPENSVASSPPHPPSRSSDASDIFYSPSRDAEEEEEENPNQQPQSPPPPPPPISNSWDYFFPGIPDLPPNSPPNHESSSSDLQPNSPLNHEISSSDPLPPPPPPWLISDLSVMKMTEELLSDWKSHQCSICIDNFEVNQMVRLTPCNHLYHSDCLLRWLDLHKSCPICRRRLSSQ